MSLSPFEPHFLSGPAGRMHFVDEGKGEPILMLHGNPSWSYMFRELIADLRSSWRCIAPDHIGMGLSDKPGDGCYAYTLASRVDDLERLLEHLGLGAHPAPPLTLLLHDWGGMIGMAYACRHPGRVKRIIVCNTAAFLNPKGMALPWQLRLGRDSRLGAFLIRGLNAFSLGAAYFCALRRPMSPATRAAYLGPYDSWDNRRAVLRFVQDIPLGPGDRSYPLVKTVDESLRLFAQLPMMLCWGGRDFVFDDRFLAEWVRRFPGAEVHRFADAGHYVVEDAGPEIAALTRAFLQAHPL